MSAEDMWADGYYDGYKAATEWHYPSKGDYPPEEGFYLVTIETPEGRGRFVSMLNYSATLENPRRRWIDCMGLEERRIVAWMPLPEPPKEKA